MNQFFHREMPINLVLKFFIVYELYNNQNGGVWNGRVCVGSVENVDFWKIRVESSPGKVPKG